MSERDSDNEPLFQNIDDLERRYAPEEVPGTDIPPEERDRGSDVGESPAQADRDDGDVPVIGVVPGAAAGGVTGAQGGPAGTGAPGVLPVAPMRDELDADEARESREQAIERDEDRER